MISLWCDFKRVSLYYFCPNQNKNKSQRLYNLNLLLLKRLFPDSNWFDISRTHDHYGKHYFILSNFLCTYRLSFHKSPTSGFSDFNRTYCLDIKHSCTCCHTNIISSILFSHISYDNRIVCPVTPPHGQCCSLSFPADDWSWITSSAAV